MYAVVRTGGKQLRVQAGDLIAVELLEGQPGDTVELSEVLLVANDSIVVGSPCVEGAVVLATIEGQTLGPKLRIFKHKRRKGYRLRKGHRQHYTQLRIQSIKA